MLQSPAPSEERGAITMLSCLPARAQCPDRETEVWGRTGPGQGSSSGAGAGLDPGTALGIPSQRGSLMES